MYIFSFCLFLGGIKTNVGPNASSIFRAGYLRLPYHRDADNHSPTRQIRVEFRIGE
jgi:hypothetical protein